MWANEGRVAPAEMIERLQDFFNSLWFDGWEQSVIEEVIKEFFLVDPGFNPNGPSGNWVSWSDFGSSG
jgi:hypothetical protein